MKTLLLLLFTLGVVHNPPSSDASFDAFTELFHEALETRDSDIYGLYFAEHVRYIHPGGQPDTLETHQVITLLSQYGQPHEVLQHLARGFVRVDRDDGFAFVTLFNQSNDHHRVRIEGTSVRLRTLPGTKSSVIALFNRGIFDGRVASNRPPICDRTSGIEWLQLELNHPHLGWVSGYMANDFVTLLPSEAPKALKAEWVHGQWLITELSAL